MMTVDDDAKTQTAAQIAANIAEVTDRIAAAAESVGRSPSDIRLLPVTKYVDEARIRAVYDLGLHSFGENRVQELRQKSGDMSDLDIHWTLIGHLQTNKANQAVRVVSEVQSVDSLRIATALNKAAERLQNEDGRAPLTILMQVNTSGEDAKYGFSPSEVRPALDQILELGGLRVGGFMTMAPFTDDLSVIRKTFADLRELRDSIREEYEGVDLRELSMGMSSDYTIAVEEGATTVRIGSTIFGARDYGN